VIVDLRELEAADGRVTGAGVTTVDDPMAGSIHVPWTAGIDYRQSGGGYYFHGAVEGTIATACQRCLVPVRHTVRGEFDLMVRRGEPADGADDVLFLAAQQFEVDFDPFVHEAIVVSTPMIIVCSEECRGLCPVCGANRNAEPCTCESPTDGRWDALKKLK
jgi:uncharacterized protein